MTQQTETPALVEASALWDTVDPRTLLSEVAESIGVGSSTDQGWAPQVASLIPPIPMSGGIPDPQHLPAKELLEAIRAATEESTADALRYGGTLGFEGLRQALAEKSQREDGLVQGPENFILTNGSSAAIDLVYRTFLRPGDVVIAESPSFSGSLRTIRGNLGRIVPVAMDREGLDTDDLERVLSRLESEGTPAKLLYTVPDYHNPMGTNLSLERRRQLIDVAARHRMLILEDDAYIDLYFEERPLPSLYAIAGGRGVLRAGSFSKTIATGLRTGWVQARADYVQLCNQMRFDMGGSPLIHRALAKYAASGQWEEHSAEVRRLYAAKCEAISEALIDECEPYMRFERPVGGFFLWLEVAPGLSARRVVEAAAEGGLICVPGHHFFLDKSEDKNIRIAFTLAPMSVMSEAAKRLRSAFEKVADEKPAAAG
jgi:DNA-binding transcriptional MocR family regulator